jgi:hypothetical protein
LSLGPVDSARIEEARGLELSVDPIERTLGMLIGDRSCGTCGRVRPLTSERPHDALDRAAGHGAALAAKLPPDLARTADLEDLAAHDILTGAVW